ncbi:MmpS family transport accessory protein [Nocardia carnea]|uniref:MmpS family transport accessory protein n=1 Tax=Nocardia carnea TaxID=37328 RepID=UPI0024542D1B|nr:MmpS family transport accessory protein [Nocardia carnea]
MTYPSGEQQGYYPPRKKPRWPWIAGGIVLVSVLVIGGCVAVFSNQVGDEQVDTGVTVTYRVDGTAPAASVTYLGTDLGMARETAVALPWSKDVSIQGWGKIVSLTANNGPDGGDITCRILVGGKVMSEQTSSGPYASASCSGDAGEQ